MKIYCNNCGNSLPPESLFCNHCGSKTGGKSDAAPRSGRQATVVEDDEYEDEYEYEDEDEEEYEEEEEEVKKPPMRRTSRRNVPHKEAAIFRITPTTLDVAPAYLLSTMLSVIVTAGVAYEAKSSDHGYDLLPYALVASAIFFLRPIFLHWRLKRTVYTLTTSKIEISWGILTKSAHSIPLRNIQDVSVNASLRERLIGIGDVLIDSAALDSKMVMHKIKNPRKYADLILDQLQYWD